MEMITVTAKTVDEAITKALIQLEISSDRLEYEVVDHGSAGFLGFGVKPAVIKARKKDEDEEFDLNLSADIDLKEEAKPSSGAGIREEPAKAAPEIKSAEKPSRYEAARQEPSSREITVNAEEAEKKVRDFLNQTFKAMGMEVEITMSYNAREKELDIDLSGKDMGVLIGKRGQTLDSLQYLISLVANKDHEGYLRIKLDTENYRERRKETLETLAKNIAFKVKRTHRSVALEPMNPYERRIIHSALQQDRYVVTKSEGEEPFRHVVVLLKRDNRDNPKKDRYLGNP